MKIHLNSVRLVQLFQIVSIVQIQLIAYNVMQITICCGTKLHVIQQLNAILHLHIIKIVLLILPYEDV